MLLGEAKALIPRAKRVVRHFRTLDKDKGTQYSTRPACVLPLRPRLPAREHPAEARLNWRKAGLCNLSPNFAPSAIEPGRPEGTLARLCSPVISRLGRKGPERPGPDVRRNIRSHRSHGGEVALRPRQLKDGGERRRRVAARLQGASLTCRGRRARICREIQGGAPLARRDPANALCMHCHRNSASPKFCRTGSRHDCDVKRRNAQAVACQERLSDAPSSAAARDADA